MQQSLNLIDTKFSNKNIDYLKSIKYMQKNGITLFFYMMKNLIGKIYTMVMEHV